jgi:hypothetical protein
MVGQGAARLGHALCSSALALKFVCPGLAFRVGMNCPGYVCLDFVYAGIACLGIVSGSGHCVPGLYESGLYPSGHRGSRPRVCGTYGPG